MKLGKALDILGKLQAKAVWNRLDKEDNKLYVEVMSWMEKKYPDLYTEALDEELSLGCSGNMGW